MQKWVNQVLLATDKISLGKHQLLHMISSAVGMCFYRDCLKYSFVNLIRVLGCQQLFEPLHEILIHIYRISEQRRPRLARTSRP